MAKFSSYQCLEPGTEGTSANANRSIPDRINDYELMDYLNENSAVLDIGCNRGYFGILLSPFIKEYLGIDHDKKQLKIGLREIKKQNIKNCTFLKSKFKKLDKKFDVILSLAVHSYIKMPMEEYGQALVDMLNPGGFLIVEGHPPGCNSVEPEKYYEPLLKFLNTRLIAIKEKTIVDRELIRPFTVFSSTCGMVSKCKKADHPNYGKITYKVYTLDYPDVNFRNAVNDHYRQELIALNRFKEEKHIPKLHDCINNALILEDCGQHLTKENMPENWKEQCSEIEEVQERHGIYHMDIFPKNLTVKDNVIYLIDWGVWSPKKNKCDITKTVKKIHRGDTPYSLRVISRFIKYLEKRGISKKIWQ